MAAARWQQLEEIFHAMLELPPERRAVALAAACGEDAELCAEVEAYRARYGVTAA